MVNSVSKNRVALWFRHVELRNFRNLKHLVIEPLAGLNVIVGANGQGKTSLLEALYLVAATRSFRTERLLTLKQHGAEAATVVAEISQHGYQREQKVRVLNSGRTILLDGKKPERLADYAIRTPVVVFQPGDIDLVRGGATGRRRLLDRVALFLNPTSLDARYRYGKVIKTRQMVLHQRGIHASELDAYEDLMADVGVQLSRARAEAAAILLPALQSAFQDLAGGEQVLKSALRVGGTMDRAKFLEELQSRRGRDLRLRSASFGPHRDDIELLISGASAREHASQGQQRLLALALKLGELNSVAQARGVSPVLLLDDVSSELDPQRTMAVEQVISQTACQVFVTTTRPELFPELTNAPRCNYTLEGGVLRVSHNAKCE